MNIICSLVHKSFIVAMNKIESIERNRIRIGDQHIPVGLSYRERFMKKLNINSSDRQAF